MDLTETQKLLGTICDEVSRKLADNNLAHACIHGAALLTMVLRRVGFHDSYPLTVGVRIFNSAYQRWVESHGAVKDDAAAEACADAGGAMILLGKGTDGMVPETRWPGHLVVVVPRAFGERHAALDLTIVQAHKPEWNITLRPLAIAVRDPFVSGVAPHKVIVNGALLIYDAYPEDHSYNEDGKWLEIRGIEEAADAVIKRLPRHCP